MTVDELRSDLTARLGEQVEQVFSRDGAPVDDITELYQPSPAGFGGQLRLKRSGRRLAWELWLEDGDRWNFHTTTLPMHRHRPNDCWSGATAKRR